MGSALARGLLVGFLVAAPIGPMALLAIRRTLDRGFAEGLASGLGIATADGAYAAVAGFGLTAVSGPLLAHAAAVQLAGGSLILALGLRGLVSRPVQADTGGSAHGGGLLAAYGSCLALTLANPPTILSFAALIAGFGILASDPRAASAFAAGVFGGSAAWWTVLSGGVARGRAALSPGVRALVNRGASAFLAVLGAVLVLHAVI